MRTTIRKLAKILAESRYRHSFGAPSQEVVPPIATRVASAPTIDDDASLAQSCGPRTAPLEPRVATDAPPAQAALFTAVQDDEPDHLPSLIIHINAAIAAADMPSKAWSTPPRLAHC